MKKGILDGYLCSDRRETCARIIEALELRPDCGRNLDALHDVLTEPSEPMELTVTHFAAMKAALGSYADRLLQMLEETAQENGAFTFVIAEEDRPLTPFEANAFGETLEKELLLRYSPIALKLLWSEDDIPEGTVRPWQDEGNRLAMCQAFALVRRNRKAYTMLKEDHWCVWPLVSYQLAPMEDADYDYMGDKFFIKDKVRSRRFLREEYPMLDCETAPIGFSIAPLRSCTFTPDLVTIYCNPAQMRSILMAAKFQTGEMLNVTMDPVDSCVHSTIPVLNGKDFNITFPDPGEYERGLTDENEVMFTLRGDRLQLLTEGVQLIARIGFGYQGLKMEMDMNFPRPPFYNAMFEKWGLETGPEWKK